MEWRLKKKKKKNYRPAFLLRSLFYIKCNTQKNGETGNEPNKQMFFDTTRNTSSKIFA